MIKARALSSNILANYVSQIYIATIGVVIVPLYVKYMGAEAYGLVGFFAMIQVWFGLLDMGFTSTMARETSRFNGGATDALTYLRLVRALEGLFLAVALAGGWAMFASAGYIASSWLHAAKLPIVEVQTAVQLIAAIVAMRWMSGFYRGIISGAERLVWLGAFNSFIATLRFIGVLLVLMFVGATPTIFFSYQFGVAVLELSGLLFHAYRLFPPVPQGQKIDWSWSPLARVIKFSSTIAFITLVWVLVTQTDKLMLSNILTLADYGYFTLAVLAASGVSVASAPVSGAIIPRMAKLDAEGDHAGLISIYRQATQLVAIISGSASITLMFCAEPLLWAWTGDKFLAHQAAPILALYAIGNGIMAVAGFPYLLQYAKGDLRLHLIGNVVFIVLLVPAIILAARQYGAIGAGYVWLGMNLLSFIAWIPLVHRKFEPGLNLKWYLQDVLVIYLFASIAGYCLIPMLPLSDNRWYLIGSVMGFGILVMFAGIFASSVFRARAAMWLGRFA